MLGGMLAGHDQSGGEAIVKNGKTYKCMCVCVAYHKSKLFSTNWPNFIFLILTQGFYGMSSSTAMDKHHGGVADYRASEGKTVEIECRGDVKNTIQDILGGLRSACTYTGSAKL